MIWRTWFLLALLLPFVSSAERAHGYSTPRRVRVGVYQNPPKVFLDSAGKPAGVFIDLIEAVAREEGWHLEFVPGTWQEGLQRVQDSEIDLMPDVAHNKARAEIYAFNAEPVLSDWFQIYARAGANVASVMDLANKRVAVLESSVQQAAFTQMIKESAFSCEVVTISSYEHCFDMVRDGEVDAVIVNRFFGRMQIENYPRLKETAIIFHPTRLHFATHKRGSPAILGAIDRHLRRWKKESGSVYFKTLKRWTGETPPVTMPEYARQGALLLGGCLLLALAFVVLLRWRVRVRTAELRMKSDALQRALDDLRSASDRLRQQEQLLALGKMASGISHDFNNVLMPILGYSDLLLGDPATLNDTALVKRYLQQIRNAAQDGAAIVKRMREFHRKPTDPQEAAPIDMGELVTSTVEMTRPMWGAKRQAEGVRINIRTSLQPVPPVLGHAAQLREVLINILFNAVDAMPAGGSIEIAVKYTDGNIKVTVSDSGEGMSDEVLANCQRPFFTTKGEAGTGMGLTMAADILDEHGGRLEVRSHRGQGTKVMLLLPPHIGGTPVAPKTGSVLAAPRRILVVDDEPRSLETLAALLRADGHVVDTETDPRHAADRAHEKPYDVIITDCAMPMMSGYELGALLHKRQPGLPVIMISGIPFDAGQAPLLAQAGVAAMLPKPVNMTDLRRIIAGFAAPGTGQAP